MISFGFGKFTERETVSEPTEKETVSLPIIETGSIS